MKEHSLFSCLRFRWFVWLCLVHFLSGNVSAAAGIAVFAGGNTEPQTLDPAQVWDDISASFTYNIYDTLVRIHPQTMAVEPGLATSWKAEDGGKTWIFELRRNVRFHDGTPCDADAVVFSFKRQLDKKFAYRYYAFPMFAEIFTFLKDVGKLGSHRVAFYLSQPFSPFLATLTVDNAAIVSPAAVIRHKQQFPRHPSGTGPFRLKEWVAGQRLVLEANPGYWKGPPAIAEYTTLFLNNFDTIETFFKQGKISIMLSYSISRLVGLRRLSWVDVLTTPVFSTQFLTFNMANPILKRKQVRQALNYLWDERALTLVYRDFARPIHSLLPQGMVQGQTMSPLYPFSIEKARRLLQQENLTSGINLNFLTLEARGSLLLGVVSHYVQNLKKAGINLIVKQVSNEEYNARIARGEYDITQSGWIADYPDPDSFFYPMFSRELQQEGFANLSSAAADPIRQLIDQARQESDPLRRREKYERLDRWLMEEALLLPLFQDVNVVVYNRSIGPLNPNALGKLSLYDLGRK